MIIRSQNKEVITNFNQVTNILLSEGEENEVEIGAMFAHDIREARLGTYSTEEKAIKVLDMIQEKYCMMNASNCMMTGTMRSLLEVTKEIQDKTIKAHRDLYVFEMPQDNEVE